MRTQEVPGRVSVIGAFSGDGEAELKKAYASALLSAQSYSKHKSAYKYALLCVLRKECRSSEVSYEYQSSAMETISQPIMLDVPDDGRYRINWEPEMKNYRISGGRDDADETRNTLEDMVQLIKDKGLL